jgi:pimeloyl-ACP methyl ester carboxylesterase
MTAGGHKAFKSWTPSAQMMPVKGAGHFLQETHGEEIAENIVNFLKKQL